MGVKTNQINIRVTPKERELLLEAADLAGLTLSRFIMSAALKEARRVGAERGLAAIDPYAADVIMSALERLPDHIEPATRSEW